jgi:hypothetical protein
VAVSDRAGADPNKLGPFSEQTPFMQCALFESQDLRRLLRSVKSWFLALLCDYWPFAALLCPHTRYLIRKRAPLQDIEIPNLMLE